jgi:hypothetical protein
MKEVFGPIVGFKIIEGPEGAPNRLDLKIDTSGIEQITIDSSRFFSRFKKDFHPFDSIQAEVVGSNMLLLILSGQRYILQAKKPELYINKIEQVKKKALEKKTSKRKAIKTRKGTGVRCVVCGREQANATCKQCGGKVCPSHSNYVGGATYCHRCMIICPKCKSPQVSAHKGGFKTGQAVLGWALGGVVLGALLGMSDMGSMELFCHSCGNRWKPSV